MDGEGQFAVLKGQSLSGSDCGSQGWPMVSRELATVGSG